VIFSNFIFKFLESDSVKSHLTMSKAITLESKIEYFRDLFHEAWEIGDFRYGIPDFRVMEKLD